MRKQREGEDYWDEHEEFPSESSSDESNFVESSLDGRSSDEEHWDGKGDSTQEGFGDSNGGGYNSRLKIAVSSLFGKMTQVNNFEELGDVVHRPQKDVSVVVKERWKN